MLVSSSRARWLVASTLALALGSACSGSNPGTPNGAGADSSVAGVGGASEGGASQGGATSGNGGSGGAVSGGSAGDSAGGGAGGSAGSAGDGMGGSGGGPVTPGGTLQRAPTVAADYSTYNPSIYFKIVSKPSGRVLTVAGGATNNGENGVIRDDTGADEQLWSIQDSVQGFKRLINKRSGRALSTNHQGDATSGAAVHIWQYLGASADQDWSIAASGTDTVKIINSARAGAALSLVQSGTANDTAAQVSDFTGTPDQGWVVVPVQTFDPTLYYRLINKNSNTALSVFHGNTANNDQADLYAIVNQPDQDWKIVSAGGSNFHVVNRKSNRLLSLTGGATINGTIAMIYDDVGASDQLWAIQALPTGFYRLVNQRRPTGVLSIVGAQAGDESRAQIYDDIGARDQSWSLVAVENDVTVNALTAQASLSSWLTGAGMEDVNHEVYGGIFSQMVFGEAFQEPASDPGVSGMWRTVSTGTASGTLALDTTTPFNGVQSQSINFASGSGELAVENRGLDRWGMSFSAGQPYDGYLYARSASSTTLSVAAEGPNGELYASTTVTVNDPGWKRYDFSLTPNASDPVGRLALTLKAPGTVSIGYIYFEPGPWGRYNGLPVRKDIADAVVSEHATVLRYGGSAILSDDYRWKHMVGPRELRPAMKNIWYAHESNGFGIFDFLNLTEAAGMLGIPTLNIGETPADMADFVEYVNGDVTSTWGAKRAADGHPAPYGLHRIELGNEQLIDDNYAAQFIALATAIWPKDPTMVLTIADMSYHHVISDPTHVTGAESGITNLAAYKKILDFAALKGGHLAIDLHTWTDNPEQVPTEVAALASFDYWVHQYNPAVDYEVDVFELNANHHDVARALGNALAIGLLEQHGGRVKVVTSANALQADGKNDNGWDQGLVFYDTQRSWLQPPAYVTQMIAGEAMSNAVNSVSSNPEVTVTAKKDALGLLLEVVNASDSAQTPVIHLIGFQPTANTMQATTLTGNRGDTNQAGNVNLVRPQQSNPQLKLNGASFTYPFAANSFTLLRLQ